MIAVMVYCFNAVTLPNIVLLLLLICILGLQMQKVTGTQES